MHNYGRMTPEEVSTLAAAGESLMVEFKRGIEGKLNDDGKLRQWFEQEYEVVRSDARFRSSTCRNSTWCTMATLPSPTGNSGGRIQSRS